MQLIKRLRLVGLVALVVFVVAPHPTVGAAAKNQPPTLPSLQVVVLVDESGSISEADVAAEKEAARTIAASALAPGSVVSVAGFGSSDGPGQSAVHVVCPPTRFDATQQRDSLAKCVGELHRRTPQEGDGTDHVAALQQALAFLGAGGPEKKIVFLLTDGKLDVAKSPQWGDTPERRNGAAAVRLQEVLGELDQAGAQVWPLGFGSVDQAALRGFARGKSCAPSAPDPSDRIIPSSTELKVAVADAFSSASCVKYGPLVTGNVPTGGSTELTVDIPVIASDASILVYKRDPRVQVEYRAPGTDKPAPAAGGSHFEFAGQTTETESLRITDPEPGQWTIRLSSADVPAQDVAATVVFQAAVKANLSVSPPQPAAGQSVSVDMQVWARGKAITDPQTLQGLSFVTTLTGSSGFPAQQVTLADPDRDGTFAGNLTIPDGATGDLTFTGQVTGIGIGGDTRVYSTRVQGRAAAIQAQVLFDTNRATVTPGGTITGTVSVTNNSGQPANLRLQIADPSPGTTLTVEPALVPAAPGVTTTPFTLRFGADTALGPNAATLRLVDDASPPAVIAERLLATEVAPEPGILEKLWWIWLGLGVLLTGALLFGVAKLRSRNEAGKVRGLRVQLAQNDFMISELEPRNPNGKAFAFVVHDDFTGLQLQHAGPAETNVYQVRRAGPQISLAPPGQQPVLLTAGKHHEIGRDGLTLAVLDERGTTGAAVAAGPVAEVSFDPFNGLPANGSSPAPTPSASWDPFESSPTPQTPTPVTTTDPFGGDPFGSDSSAVPPSKDFDPNNPFGG